MPYLLAGGLRIHYADTPPAAGFPTLVFVHGAGANHTIWLGQMKALRRHARILIPDLPGHGRSEPIPGLTIEEYARALAPVLEEAGRGAPLLIAGHSMGAAIALSLGLERPDLLSGLVLVGAGATLAVSPAVLEGLERSPAETQALVARWQFTKEADPGLVLRTARDLAGIPAARVLADFRACDRFDLREHLARIDIPALVICGVEDRMTPPGSSRFLCERLPRASLRLIEGAGHAVMIEKPDAVSGEIAAFLEAV